MSFLVNPELFRVNVTNYWKTTWVNSDKKSYRLNFHDNLLFDKFLTQFINNPVFIKHGLAISHFTKSINRKKIFINIFLYDNIDSSLKFTSNYLNRKLKIKKFNYKRGRILIKKINFFSKILIMSLFWKTYNLSFSLRLKKFTQNKIILNIFKLSKNDTTPYFIIKYIIFKLKQGHRLPWIIRPILRNLKMKKNNGEIAGFKLLYAGRFTRKQIADYAWTTYGKYSLNSIKSKVKFGIGSVRLKYGVCGLKLWIDYTTKKKGKIEKQLIQPYLLPNQIFFKKKKRLFFFNLNSFQKKYIKFSGFYNVNTKAYKAILNKVLCNLIVKSTSRYEKKLIKLKFVNSTNIFLKKISIKPYKRIIYE